MEQSPNSEFCSSEYLHSAYRARISMVVCIYVGLKMGMLPLGVSCWSLFLFDLDLFSFTLVGPFIYSNVENPTVFGTFSWRTYPSSYCLWLWLPPYVAIDVCSGKTSEAFGLNLLLNRSSLGLLSSGWLWDDCAVHRTHNQSWAWTSCGL